MLINIIYVAYKGVYMIKRLIFDVDNTLIDWEDDYWDSLELVFRDLGIQSNENLKNTIITAIDNYEKSNIYYSKQKMLQCINDKLEEKLPYDFIELCLKYFEKCISKNVDKEIINTLEYLSNKYEIVVLTNWFKEEQVERLKNAGMLKYIKEVYAPETFKTKPHPESYITAIDEHNPDECIMIGDNIITDINGALNAGLKAIYYDKTAKEEKKDNGKYITINKISKLMDIL